MGVEEETVARQFLAFWLVQMVKFWYYKLTYVLPSVTDGIK